MDGEEEEDIVVVAEDHLFDLIVENWAMYFDSIQIHVHYMGTTTI
jgi:hypothetical protein